MTTLQEEIDNMNIGDTIRVILLTGQYRITKFARYYHITNPDLDGSLYADSIKISSDEKEMTLLDGEGRYSAILR